MSADDEHRGDPSREDHHPDPREGRSPRFSGLRSTAKRMVNEVPLREAKEVLGAVLDSSDRAKTEAVRMIGREVRSYLEGLGLKEDIHYLLTNYSLEVKASFHLKPLREEEEPKAKREGE